MFEPISNLAEINPPLRASTTDLSDALISFIPMGDVSESGQWLTHRTRPLREVKSGFTPFQEGDVLFAKITPCMENGKGAYAVGLENGIGYGSTEFHVLRAKAKNSPRYIFHLSQSSSLRLKAEASMIGSAGQKRVPSNFFLKHQVFAPNAAEQRLIARILDTLDTQIQKTEALIAKLEKVKEGLLHDLLTRGIDENGQLRPSPEKAPELYKKSPLGLIPKEWQETYLSAVSEKITDGTHQAVKTIASNDQSIPFLYVSCIRNGSILWDNAAAISHDDFSVISKGREPQKGMVLYTAVGSYGHASAVETEDPFSFQRHIACITPDRKRIKTNFASYFLNSSRVKRHAEKVALGNAQKTVTLGELSYYPITFPTLVEQEEVCKRLSCLDFDIKSLGASLSKLTRQKAGLMDDLLTGRVRVTPLLEKAQATTPA